MTSTHRLAWTLLALVALGSGIASTSLSVTHALASERRGGIPGEDVDGAESPVPAATVAEALLVVSAEEHALVLKDPESGERTAFFRVGISPNAVAVSPDGRTAVVANRGERISGTTICVVDLYASNLVRTIPLEAQVKNPDRTMETRAFHRPSGLIFLPDGRRVLVTCAIEGALLMVDLVEARVTGHVELGAEGSHDVAVDHEGRFAYVANRGSGTVSVIKLARMEFERNIEAGGGPRGMALHPIKDEIWVTNTDTNSISIIDLETRNESMEFACGAMPVDVSFTPDGKRALVTNMQEGNVSVFESDSHRIEAVIHLDRVSETQAELRPVNMPGRFGRSPLPTQIIVEPSGERAWISTRRDDRLHLVDLKKRKVVAHFEAPTAPDDLGWSTVSRGPVPVASTDGR